MSSIHENARNEVCEVAPLMSNILVPVNFSKRSAGTANFALGLARHFHAKITLLHVERPVEGDTFWTIETAHWAKEQMANFLLESERKADVQRIVSLHSDIAGEILRIAVDAGADLIVISTHGSGTIRRVLLGSVAARVLREAVCPVWAIPYIPPTAPAQWIQPARILCAVDPGQAGTGVLAWASNLALQLNSKLCAAWSRKGLTDGREEIDRLEGTYRICDETVIEAGNVPNLLRRAAAAMQADLLVVDRNFGKPAAGQELDIYQVARKLPYSVVSMGYAPIRPSREGGSS